MRDRLSQRIDSVTVAGLALLLGPLTTMWHELAGHGATCLALGGRLSEIGAFYIECPGVARWAGRLVAMAGTGADWIACLVAYLLWRRARGDFSRLLLWLVFTVKGMVAAGYFLFSGASGIGDWGPGVDGGIGPLPQPMLVRAVLFAVGLAAYVAVLRLAITSLRTMLGGNAGRPLPEQRRMALTFYLAHGAVSVLVGLFNPHGLFITLASAAASSFGGTAGFWSIAYARNADSPRPFIVGRNGSVLILGLLVTLAFAAILGPTVRP